MALAEKAPLLQNNRELTLEVEPFGPEPRLLEEIGQRAALEPAVQALLSGSCRHLLMVDDLCLRPYLFAGIEPGTTRT